MQRLNSGVEYFRDTRSDYDTEDRLGHDEEVKDLQYELMQSGTWGLNEGVIDTFPKDPEHFDGKMNQSTKSEHLSVVTEECELVYDFELDSDKSVRNMSGDLEAANILLGHEADTDMAPLPLSVQADYLSTKGFVTPESARNLTEEVRRLLDEVSSSHRSSSSENPSIDLSSDHSSTSVITLENVIEKCMKEYA